MSVVSKKKIEEVKLSDRDLRKIELEKKRREVALKKLANLSKKTMKYLSSYPDKYIVYEKHVDYFVMFKKMTLTIKRVNTNSIFMPRESHDEETFFHVFVLKFMKEAKVKPLLTHVPFFIVREEGEIPYVLEQIQ